MADLTRSLGASSAPVGIVGAGQLARMMVQAAIPLAIPVRLLAERPDEAAALIAVEVAIGSPRSLADLAAFAADSAVTTFDHELVDVAALARLEAAGRAVRPGAAVMALVQSKRRQRQMLVAHGFPVPAFAPVAAAADLTTFGAMHGWPIVAKADRGGYDGRGVWVLADELAATTLFQRATAGGTALIAEAFVPIEREVAILVARRPSGDMVTYPLVETVQVNGICRELIAPAPAPAAIQAEAAALATAIAAATGVVGILAVELFLSEGRLLVNELAARPHNSGHYTIEGCTTSQFAQHLRAVLDWPLGSTALLAPAVATVNILGGAAESDPLDHVATALAVPGAHPHLYGKSARPGRKLGHVTCLGDDPAATLERARRAAALLLGAPLTAPT